jgi:glycosyltransferase involved in cell wall biosynthesis
LIRRIAVIVPAANEEQRIARCLASIAAAHSHPHLRNADVQARVLVVLDSCRDATAVIAGRFADVGSVAITARSVGAARRAGALAAIAAGSGPPSELWLASTDADSEVAADWLAVMVAEAGRGAPGAGDRPAWPGPVPRRPRRVAAPASPPGRPPARARREPGHTR